MEKKCEHKIFITQTKVTFIKEGGIQADIRIYCQECNTPLKFKGVDSGLSFDEPKTDLTGCELRLQAELLDNSHLKNYN